QSGRLTNISMLEPKQTWHPTSSTTTSLVAANPSPNPNLSSHPFGSTSNSSMEPPSRAAARDRYSNINGTTIVFSDDYQVVVGVAGCGGGAGDYRIENPDYDVYGDGMAFVIAQDDQPSPSQSFGSYMGILGPPAQVVNKRKSDKTGSTNNNHSGAAVGKASWQPIKPKDDMESEEEAEVVLNETVNFNGTRSGASNFKAPDRQLRVLLLAEGEELGDDGEICRVEADMKDNFDIDDSINANLGSRKTRRVARGLFNSSRSLFIDVMTELTKKDSFHWGVLAQSAFEELKKKMISAPVLALPNFSQPFEIECDASGRGIGDVFMQSKKPIAYFIKALWDTNLNKSAYEKEIMALVLAIQHWRPYLLGQNFTRYKASTVTPEGLLQPLLIPNSVWKDISLKFITGLPKSKSYDVELVVVDRLSKYCHFVPLKHPLTARTLAEIFLRDNIRLHGIPKSVLSDRDSLFLSRFWQEIFSLQGSNLKFSFAYHQETNGQTEVVNRSLETYLRFFNAEQPKTWSYWLPWAEFWGICCEAVAQDLLDWDEAL
nr:retrotransposon-related protein [Tanacetum cinerariifolium]